MGDMKPGRLPPITLWFFAPLLSTKEESGSQLFPKGFAGANLSKELINEER